MYYHSQKNRWDKYVKKLTSSLEYTILVLLKTHKLTIIYLPTYISKSRDLEHKVDKIQGTLSEMFPDPKEM